MSETQLQRCWGWQSLCHWGWQSLGQGAQQGWSQGPAWGHSRAQAPASFLGWVSRSLITSSASLFKICNKKLRSITFLIQLVKYNIWDHPPLIYCVGDSFSDGMYRTGHENVGWLFLLFILAWLSLKYFFCISYCSIRSFCFLCTMESLRALCFTGFLCQGASKQWKFRYHFLVVRFHLYPWLQWFCLPSVVVVPDLLVYTIRPHQRRFLMQGLPLHYLHYLLIVSFTSLWFYPLAPSSPLFAVPALSRVHLLQHLQNSSWSSWLGK